MPLPSLRELLLDNPLLVKHARSRLRRSQVVPGVTLALAAGIAIVWAGRVLNWHIQGWTVGAVLGIQLFLLAFAGGNQVGTSVGNARASGILDYHRIAPMSPTAVALGFLLGAPVREYLLTALMIPFLAACCHLAGLGLASTPMLMVLLLLVAWNLHALALMLSLVAKKPRAATQGSVVGLLLLGMIFGGPLVGGLRFVLNLFADPAPAVSVFGFRLHWLPFAAVYLGVPLGFFLAGGCRKMRSDRTHVFAKPTAAAFLASAALLTVGACWGRRSEVSMVLVVLYVTSVLALFLIPTITPDRAEYLKGLRHARALRRSAARHGQRRRHEPRGPGGLRGDHRDGRNRGLGADRGPWRGRRDAARRRLLAEHRHRRVHRGVRRAGAPVLPAEGR